MDNHFENQTKEQIIVEYVDKINRLKLHAMRNGVTEIEFDKIFLQSFLCHPLSFNYRNNLDNIINFLRKRLILIILVAILVFLLCYKQETSSIILRNIQVFIYPGMKLWRKLTLPIIERYPSLTEYYDESCLVNNPLFQVLNLTCDPCVGAINVIEMTEYHPYINTTPVTYSSTQLNLVTILKLRELYEENLEIFRKDAFRVESTNKEIRNLDDLFHDFRERNRTDKQEDSHNLLRCNRMGPARVLRTLFQKPNNLPSTGINLERFLTIDTPRAQAYHIPDTECSNVFLMQGHGSRIIILRPTAECRNVCKTLTMKLEPGHVLIYNWWYWKPVSMPDKSSYSTSMTYVGSFC